MTYETFFDMSLRSILRGPHSAPDLMQIVLCAVRALSAASGHGSVMPPSSSMIRQQHRFIASPASIPSRLHAGCCSLRSSIETAFFTFQISAALRTFVYLQQAVPAPIHCRSGAACRLRFIHLPSRIDIQRDPVKGSLIASEGSLVML